MVWMSEHFVPFDYLKENDRNLLQKTQQNIKIAKTSEELRYYEAVLDMLMERAVKNYKEENQNQHLQNA